MKRTAYLKKLKAKLKSWVGNNNKPVFYQCDCINKGTQKKKSRGITPGPCGGFF